MKRLSILAKGNLDLRDSLVAAHDGGVLAWNGLNAALADRFPGHRAHVRHETFTRSDALLAATGAIPAEMALHDPPLGPYPLAGQFADTLFQARHDAVILSIQPDLMTVLARHVETGDLFYPYGAACWPEAYRRWLAGAFGAEPLLAVERSMANLAAIVARRRAVSDAPILIYNVPCAVRGERVHDYAGLDETFATRIRRFNLGLIDLSRETGVSIVDVDALVAREGARTMTLDPLHLTPAGCRLVAAEVVHILDDLGCFA